MRADIASAVLGLMEPIDLQFKLYVKLPHGNKRSQKELEQIIQYEVCKALETWRNSQELIQDQSLQWHIVPEVICNEDGVRNR